MTSETAKIKSKLLALTSAFDDLESQLAPLFAQTLPETLLGLEPIQQAKLQTALPYVIYDLIFIYLKTRGVDPRTHPVISELDRIKQYFEKIQNAENPPAKRAEIDKDAAARFIKHAIAQSQWKKTAAEALDDDSTNASTSASASAKPAIPVKVTSKMLERKQYEEELKASDEKEGEEVVLDVYESKDVMDMDVEPSLPKPSKSKSMKSKGKEKEKESQMGSLPDRPSESMPASKKRRRPVIDPFAGYGDIPATSIPATPGSDQTTTKKKKSKRSDLSSEEVTPKPDIDADPSSEKKTKKSKKKAKTLS